jgi:type I restriction enzyme S subunit
MPAMSEVADIVMGQSPRGTACNRDGIGVPLLNGPTEFGQRSPNPAQWTTSPTRIANTDDILFCVRGSTTGRMNIADQEYCVGRGVAAIRGNDDIDTEFIRYAIIRRLPELLSLTAGSVFPNLSGDDIRGFRIPWPDRDIREFVVETLGTLDDKIGSNIRASGVVTSLLPHLFADLCPSTGEAIPLSEIATFRKGVSYRRADLQPSSTAMVTLKSFDRNGGYKLDGLKPYVGEFKVDQEILAGELAVAQTDLTQNAEVVGRVIRVPRPRHFQRLVGSLDLSIVRPKQDTEPEYLYSVLLADRFREHCRSRTSGTTVLHLSGDALPSYQVPVVEMEDQRKFSETARPLLQQREVLDQQSEVLQELRDVLMAELMTGRSNLEQARELVGGAV